LVSRHVSHFAPAISFWFAVASPLLRLSPLYRAPFHLAVRAGHHHAVRPHAGSDRSRMPFTTSLCARTPPPPRRFIPVAHLRILPFALTPLHRFSRALDITDSTHADTGFASRHRLGLFTRCTALALLRTRFCTRWFHLSRFRHGSPVALHWTAARCTTFARIFATFTAHARTHWLPFWDHRTRTVVHHRASPYRLLCSHFRFWFHLPGFT